MGKTEGETNLPEERKTSVNYNQIDDLLPFKILTLYKQLENPLPSKIMYLPLLPKHHVHESSYIMILIVCGLQGYIHDYQACQCNRKNNF